LPALWNGKLPIIVVGAVDNNGTRLDFTQYSGDPSYPGSGVNVYAPGALQDCEVLNGEISESSGTSIGACFP
jgi:hypothetical protein